MTLSSPTAPRCPLPNVRQRNPPPSMAVTVKGLTRCYDGIDNEARSAPAAAEPPLAGTVWTP